MMVVQYSVPGQLSATISDTGLSAGAQKYRIVARVSTNAPSSAVSVTFSGKVEVRVP